VPASKEPTVRGLQKGDQKVFYQKALMKASKHESMKVRPPQTAKSLERS